MVQPPAFCHFLTGSYQPNNPVVPVSVPSSALGKTRQVLVK